MVSISFSFSFLFSFFKFLFCHYTFDIHISFLFFSIYMTLFFNLLWSTSLSLHTMSITACHTSCTWSWVIYIFCCGLQGLYLHICEGVSFHIFFSFHLFSSCSFFIRNFSYKQKHALTHFHKMKNIAQITKLYAYSWNCLRRFFPRPVLCEFECCLHR